MNLNYKNMKQTFIHILLGFFIATTIAAGTMAVTTVKPATPKYVIVKEFDRCDEATPYINSCLKSGWIVKSITGLSGEGMGFRPVLVILEKY
jgi:hypothetical protein